MKIRKPTPETYPKVYALLKQVSPNSPFDAKLIENLHKNKQVVHEWACIHRNSVIAYVAFSNAYHGSDVCGLHLAPLAVKPEFQRQGIGTELLGFALRQNFIKENTIFVLGKPGFFRRFGFESCMMPISIFGKKVHFLSLRNHTTSQFTVKYESAFNNR